MLTALLHTRNRPEFLIRAINYYNDKFHYPLFILDASDDNYFNEIASNLIAIKPRFPLEILHHHGAVPLYQRFSDVLRKISSPYILLMADDDLYYEPWIDASMRYLEEHPSCGTVYGHAITFELDSYIPFGGIKRFAITKPNPVARWMEHESPIDRLAELGKGPWTTTGWYAMQRTEIFRKIVYQAKAAQFNNEMLERLLTILQPIYGKVVMLDDVYLARQVNPFENRRAYSYKANKFPLEDLVQIAADALSQVCSMDKYQAELIINKTLEKEINKLKWNDLREAININYWKATLSFVYQFVRFSKEYYKKNSRRDPLAPDHRFPTSPALSEARQEINVLIDACKPSVITG